MTQVPLAASAAVLPRRQSRRENVFLAGASDETLTHKVNVFLSTSSSRLWCSPPAAVPCTGNDMRFPSREVGQLQRMCVSTYPGAVASIRYSSSARGHIAAERFLAVADLGLLSTKRRHPSITTTARLVSFQIHRGTHPRTSRFPSCCCGCGVGVGYLRASCVVFYPSHIWEQGGRHDVQGGSELLVRQRLLVLVLHLRRARSCRGVLSSR